MTVVEESPQAVSQRNSRFEGGSAGAGAEG